MTQQSFGVVRRVEVFLQLICNVATRCFQIICSCSTALPSKGIGLACTPGSSSLLSCESSTPFTKSTKGWFLQLICKKYWLQAAADIVFVKHDFQATKLRQGCGDRPLSSSSLPSATNTRVRVSILLLLVGAFLSELSLPQNVQEYVTPC